MSAFKATIKDTRYLEENTDEKASYGPIAAHRDDSKECCVLYAEGAFQSMSRYTRMQKVPCATE